MAGFMPCLSSANEILLTTLGLILFQIIGSTDSYTLSFQWLAIQTIFTSHAQKEIQRLPITQTENRENVFSLKHLQVQQLYTLITIPSSSSTPQTPSHEVTHPQNNATVCSSCPSLWCKKSHLTLEFSGCTFLVLISGSDVTIRLHHSIWFTWDTSWTPILHQLFHPTWKKKVD